MKALNNLKKLISTVEGYKHQFVENGLPNILVVDPVMSRFDFYTLILPSILLTQTGKANVAFTGISKFTDSEDKKPIDLTDMEIMWANIIVFPFSIDDYNYNGKHLFDAIREMNPRIKVIFVCEVLFSHSKFIKSLIDGFNKASGNPKLDKEGELKILDYVKSGIKEKLNKADRILVPNDYIKKEVLKINQDATVELILPYNYNEVIREGLNPNEISESEIMEFLAVDETRVLIHFVNTGKASEWFLKNVIEQAPDNVIFYSQTKMEGINTLPICSITHWYKILFTHSFDYTLFVGDFNKYDISSQYLDGVIVDSLFMRSIPVVTNQHFNSVLTVKDFEMVKLEDCLEFVSQDVQERSDAQKIYFNKIKKHEVDKDVVDYFESLFLKF